MSIYISAIEKLICHTGSTSFAFAQNTLHDFQNTVLELIVALSSRNATKAELERIFCNSVVMVMAFRPGVLGSNPVRSLYFCYTFVHSCLCCGLCS